MKCKIPCLTLPLLLLWGISGPYVTIGQDLDGPKHIFKDELLDHLAGSWKLTGTVMGRTAEHTVQAEWVLNHQFLRLHEKQNDTPSDGSVQYEAWILVGYDNTSERYVVHWNDVYGGRFSETLGYGTRIGDEIRFVFEYPDGPFHTTFRWLPESHQWSWRMRSRDKQGNWKDFADFILTSAKQL